MADTPGPGAALLGRPAAVANGHDLDAPVGCLAPGDRNQAAAHPARGPRGPARWGATGSRPSPPCPASPRPSAARPAASAWRGRPGRDGHRPRRHRPPVAGVIIVGAAAARCKARTLAGDHAGPRLRRSHDAQK